VDGETWMRARPVFGRCAAYVALAIVVVAIQQWHGVTGWFFYRQDLWVGLLFIAALLATMRWQPRVELPVATPRASLVYGTAVILATLLWAGTHLVMLDYPVSRDEHMVVFDGAIFASGRLTSPLPPEWTGYAEAFVPAFLLEVPGHPALVSAYMPMNAAIRAGVGLVMDPALMNPLLAGLGLVLLYRVAMRLFADFPPAVWLVIGGYILSAQVLVAAMTTYAMTAHLALNLLWLVLFLRGGLIGHLAAAVVGVVAIGLHQIIFHPLFAGPFLLMLLPQRRWMTFLAYATIYAAALLFWISWPSLILQDAGLMTSTGSGAGSGGFLMERVWPLLLERDPSTVPLMINNLLRATTWNPLFALPFLVFAYPAVRRCEGLALPLFGGVVLTILAMMILLPYQGHGWGYRYIHGLLGSVLLLAGYGFRELASGDRRLAGGTAVLLGGTTLVFVLPFLLATAHMFVRPHAKLYELIARQPTDFVLVDSERPSVAVDEVRNLPDLSNRPLIFSSRDLTASQIARLCDRGSVTLVSGEEYYQAGLIAQPDRRRPVEAKLSRAGFSPTCLRRAVS
jgi:hypothetical protein